MGSSENAYGKTVSELQTDVTVGETDITGTLHYVTGYTGFNGSEPDEQEGNYLALQFTCDPWPDELTVELVGGTKGEVTLSEEDDFCIFRIANKDSQSIKVSSMVGDSLTEKTYALSGLVLESQE